MDVSHFELIWKPQSPQEPQGSTAVAAVLQGYFLEITNLEDVSYRYSVDFVAAPVTEPLRSLAGNTVVFVDTPGTDNTAGFLTGSITDTIFRPSTGSITIPAKGTALIAVLPSAFGAFPFEPTPLTGPNFEVRGYVRLRLPTVFRQIPSPTGIPRFAIAAQASAPVKVMLTAQNRATYFTENGVISDQTQASLPLASGAAVNALAPDQPFRFTALSDSALDFNPARAQRVMELIGEEGMVDAAAAMLTTMADAGADLSSFNKSLARQGVALAIERRKVPA